ncbi:MAG: CDP-glycerol glycerophosphotransferase family protein [Lachnospiraceae bacterium]|nr:CDP-glycerol glycerophosphotransferase family protein [Lachnospiraceae bacterium]
MSNEIQLKSVSWERIYLRLVIGPSGQDQTKRQEGALAVFLADATTGRCCGRAQTKALSDGSVEAVWNVTNRGDERCLAPGAYRFALTDNDRFVGYLRADQALSDSDAEGKDAPAVLDREFRYQKTGSYRVELSGSKDGELVVRILQKSPAGGMKGAASKSKKKLLTAYYLMQKKRYAIHAESRKKTVLFLTEQAEQLGDNLTAVYEKLRARGDGYRLLTSCRSIRTKAYGKKSTLRLLSLMAQSGVIVIDDHVPILDWLMLGEDTKLIQLWHAGVGFKATGYSRWGHSGAVGPVSCHRQISLATVSSLQIRRIFSELWGIDDARVIPCGIPRMDAFLDPEIAAVTKERLLQRYPICKGKKVILLAPTYRGRSKKDAHYPFEKIDFPALRDAADRQGYIVLCKMHPWVKETGYVPKECQDVILETDPDASINDLFLITDLLITDYSSNLFEFSVLQRPMLFYAFDEEEYGRDRGFHRPYRENAPGKVVSSFSQLLSAIETEDFEAEKLTEYVKRHFDHPDTGACDRVIDWLIEGRMPDAYRDALTLYQEETDRWKRMRFPV